MSKEAYTSKIESYQEEAESGLDKEEDFLKVMHRDLTNIDELLPRLDSAESKEEVKRIYDQLKSSDMRVQRETRKIYRFIKRILRPYQSMISTSRKEIKQLKGVIERRKQKISELDNLSKEHKTVKQFYKRDGLVQDINQAEQRIQDLDAYIGDAEKILSNTQAIEQRLLYYASRNGELHRRLGMINKDINSDDVHDVSKLSHNTRDDMAETFKAEKGLFSSSESMRRFIKGFKVAMIAVAMSLAAFGASADEAQSNENRSNGLTDSQIETVETRYQNLNQFAGRNQIRSMSEIEDNGNYRSGVYYLNAESGNIENDKFVVVMENNNRVRSQARQDATMNLVRGLTAADVLLSSSNIRALPFEEEIGPDGKFVMTIDAEFVEENLLMPSLQAELGIN
ncbi:MAG: hypothetical protein ACLFSL_03870 [Candidatus Woesearchaeota archaeon]